MPSMTLSEAYNKVSQTDSFCFVHMLDGTILPIEEVLTVNSLGDGKIDLVPGSFNPLHEAHEAIYRTVWNPHKFYELSLSRVNKWSLTLEEMQKCLEQFVGKAPVIVMNPPLFIQKAGVLYKWDVKFHIGFDTAARLLDQSSAIEIQGIRAKFEVYDRKMGEQIFTIQDLNKPIPSNFFHGKGLPETVMGLSSTQIRAKDKVQ